jgi:hypothetical protein
MTTTPARTSVNHGGRKQVLPGVADPVREVSRLLRAYTDASHVTVSIKLPDKHETVLVALEAGNAFVGLETADGVYQYVVDEAWGKRPVHYRWQATRIDTATCCRCYGDRTADGRLDRARARMGTEVICM